VVRVEAIELAVDRQVDTGELLEVQDDGGRVAEALLAWVGEQP
jgi:hypothetical protein